eukprot:CAMPEP_0195510266 /NCGR_PEP_ID=MMETSP0794_2-20130614/2960_1 /TAXON_ID=515487 /ORGANISM="Stephanopyxis turris, Strain CCMP 815" /LENGTH=257 /DNA_ID=CAMNT_0040637651 /DNA_START=203 /DNA_END=973 /DNA_ORIENTATION=+
MAYTDICGSKLRRKMGAVLNESVSAPTSSFAQKQLEKMGWNEGEGLGKKKGGMTSHIKVKIRAEDEGLGHDKVKVAQAADQWWSASVSDTLFKLQQKSSSSLDKKSKKKKKKKSKEKRKSKGKKEATTTPRQYTDDELFVATGGARFGMRAQRRAEAKWARTEKGGGLQESETKAKASMEWNGTGKANLLIDGKSLESKPVDNGTIQTEGEDKSHSKQDSIKKKKRKKAQIVSSDSEEGSSDKKGKKEKKEKKKKKK